MLAAEGMGQLTDIGPFDLGEGRERVRRGDRCYCLWLDGRLAHYCWVQQTGSHPIEPAAVSVSVRPGVFWLYNARTAEWARRRGIFRATLERIVTDYFAAGYHTAWIYVVRENVASQKAVLRSGFELDRVLSALRMGTHYFRCPIRASSFP
jgi:RimJ/RimL family protein N-acetyltransferase